MMKTTLISLISVFLLFYAGCQEKQAETAAEPAVKIVSDPVSAYIERLSAGLDESDTKMAEITASAEKAAKMLVTGGNIYVDGSQPGFISEALGRAGGLIALKSADGPGDSPTQNDVVIMAMTRITPRDTRQIAVYKADGAYVAVFCSAGTLENLSAEPNAAVTYSGPEVFLPNPQADNPAVLPVDSVMNVINMWAWTGELAGACTRLGKMPAMYQSHLLPGGKERTAELKHSMFHENLEISPVKPGVLGKAYIYKIRKSIHLFSNTQRKKLSAAADMLRPGVAGRIPLLLSTGHMFPAHFEDRRTRQIFQYKRVPANQPPTFSLAQNQPVLYLGYQYTDGEMLRAAKQNNCEFVYISSDKRNADICPECVYLNPYWPISDGCVRVPGYDVPVLPASGVMNAAVYWSLMAEIFHNGK